MELNINTNESSQEMEFNMRSNPYLNQKDFPLATFLDPRLKPTGYKPTKRELY